MENTTAIAIALYVLGAIAIDLKMDNYRYLEPLTWPEIVFLAIVPGTIQMLVAAATS